MNKLVKEILIKVHKHPNSPYVFTYKNGQRVRDIRFSFFTALEKSGIKEAPPFSMFARQMATPASFVER